MIVTFIRDEEWTRTTIDIHSQKINTFTFKYICVSKIILVLNLQQFLKSLIGKKQIYTWLKNRIQNNTCKNFSTRLGSFVRHLEKSDIRLGKGIFIRADLSVGKVGRIIIDEIGFSVYASSPFTIVSNNRCHLESFTRVEISSFLEHVVRDYRHDSRRNANIAK